MGKLLSIDYGHKRIGLALSDEERLFVRGLDTLVQTKKLDPLDSIVELLERHSVEGIVLGLPLNMDGSEGFMAEAVRDFADRLGERTDVPIYWMDERLSSVIAQQHIKASGKSPSKNKGLIDQEAARQLLEDFIRRDRLNPA